MVANEFWIYPWGLVSIPGKNINVLFKELYQLFSLLLGELRSDLKKLLWIISYSNFHKIFTLYFLGWLIDGFHRGF